MRKALDHDSSSNKRHETQTSHLKKTDQGNSTSEALKGSLATVHVAPEKKFVTFVKKVLQKI